jgi:hypothetical protein
MIRQCKAGRDTNFEGSKLLLKEVDHAIQAQRWFRVPVSWVSQLPFCSSCAAASTLW